MSSAPSPITLGTDLQSLQTASFFLAETTHDPLRRLPRHHHDHPNITLLLEGSFVETFDRRSVECGPQSLLIKPAGEVHSNRYGQHGARCLVIAVQAKGLLQACGEPDPLNSIVNIQDRTVFDLTTRIMSEHRTRDFASPLALEGLLLELVAHIARYQRARPGTEAPRWLERARDLVHNQFYEDLHLGSIAQDVDRHPVHVAREFRNHYGMTIGEYLRNRRLEFACEALARSDRPIVDIAHSAGFCHQSHLTRLIKGVTGLTPSQYRRRFQAR
jgi:AraC family transcriptional regulator